MCIQHSLMTYIHAFIILVIYTSRSVTLTLSLNLHLYKTAQQYLSQVSHYILEVTFLHSPQLLIIIL